MTARLGGKIKSLVAFLVCGYRHMTVALSATTISTEETEFIIEQAEYRKRYKEWKPRDIDKIFREHQIVPDVVDDSPVNVSKILFPFNHSPEFGNEMNLSLHTNIDWAQWPGTLNDTYTLIYTIPDVPSRESPTSGEYQVWIVGNIEGPVYIQNETLTEYVKPTHPNGTGLHRHVFLVYKQPFSRLINFDEPFLDANTPLDPRRYNFSTRAFAKKYDLGKPAAGNLFLAY